jgi:uncharacterized protein (DUF1330 family)
MSTLIVVDLTPVDAEILKAYSANAAETLKPFGGEFLAKGAISALHGDSQFTTKVVIQFPDRERAVNWYDSAAYQRLIPNRDMGMDSQFHLVT